MDGVVVLIWCLMMLVSVIDYAANYEPPWKIRGCFFRRRPEDPLAPLVHPPHVGRLHRTCTDFAAVFFSFWPLIVLVHETVHVTRMGGYMRHVPFIQNISTNSYRNISF